MLLRSAPTIAGDGGETVMAYFRTFVKELPQLVDGCLAHVLDCGHTRVPGLCRKSDGIPITRQWCAECWRLKSDVLPGQASEGPRPNDPIGD